MIPFRTVPVLIVLFAAALAVPTASEQYVFARLGGFSQPESISYDPGTGVMYVSNINSPDFSPNGVGFISRLNPEFTI